MLLTLVARFSSAPMALASSILKLTTITSESTKELILVSRVYDTLGVVGESWNTIWLTFIVEALTISEKVNVRVAIPRSRV